MYSNSPLSEPYSSVFGANISYEKFPDNGPRIDRVTIVRFNWNTKQNTRSGYTYRGVQGLGRNKQTKRRLTPVSFGIVTVCPRADLNEEPGRRTHFAVFLTLFLYISINHLQFVFIIRYYNFCERSTFEIVMVVEQFKRF